MGICARLVRGLGRTAFVLAMVFSACAAADVATVGMALAQAAASNIVVEGNRRVEADTIRSYFHRGPGGQLDAVQIDSALKGLYATGLFQDVRISHASGRLVVTVVENPVINRVAFEGNKRVKDEQLKLEIQSKERGTFSRPMVQSDVQRLVEMYRRSGRFDVTITPKVIDLPNNRVDLVFEINEGAKTGVKKILFVGNHAYSDMRLKDVIKTTETNFLSFLKTTDIYDPDRIEADRELLRRFYLKHGFVDVQIVSANAEYDPDKKGFIVTFTIDEGQQYRFGAVDIQSNIRVIDAASLRNKLRMGSGDVYNAEAVEKTVEDMSIEIAKRGYPFSSVRPRGDRNPEAHSVAVTFVIDEGPRVYIERINIRGNTRTRDYVIRREFDIGEGDAYNRALVERAERRLKNLNYFKTVKITTEPGSSPDRIILNVDVEEQSTGEFSIAGGYSTADGFIGEVSVGERNLLGRGQYAKAALQYGQRTRGFQFSFVEPYFLDYRWSMGYDIFYKNTLASSYTSYDSKTVGGTLRTGFGLTENVALQLSYSIYQREISYANNYLTVCGNQLDPACYTPGVLIPSLPVRIELNSGKTLTSMVGYALAYNTLDNNKNPTSGIYAELKQDFAGLGGDIYFLRNSADVRWYRETLPDIIAVLHLQGGQISGWGSHDLRMLDHFQMGPNLVRGFATNGIGPRDLTPGTTNDAIGGTMYWGASLEFQIPLYFIPKDIGMRGAIFADAGSLWGYKGPTVNPSVPETFIYGDSSAVRSSVGAGIIWDSPLGPLRFDYAIALTKESYDKVQQFRFGGGTKF